MRIAFVSYEYAGIAEGGGIGTYVRQTAAMLAARGHSVEVFTSWSDARLDDGGDIRVTQIRAPRELFSRQVVPYFLAAHECDPFDVIESAEYGADIEYVIRAAENVPRVVKLHTAAHQIAEINDEYISLRSKARFIAGAIRRGRAPKPFWSRSYNPNEDPERDIAISADEVTAPSTALLERTARAWRLDFSRSVVIPHVFLPDASLAALSPARDGATVTFIGKLEVRKGILDLAKAIPAVVRECPDVRFRFVGRSLPHPATGESLDATVTRLAGRLGSDRLEFVGAVPYSEISGYLGASTIAVFPSHWEAFGFVCLEAMAAGCAVVGSSAGGMSEIITHEETGLLVPPRDPKALSAAIVYLLRNSEQRTRMAKEARAHVLSDYAPDRIAPLQEASYARAIDRARLRCATR